MTQQTQKLGNEIHILKSDELDAVSGGAKSLHNEFSIGGQRRGRGALYRGSHREITWDADKPVRRLRSRDLTGMSAYRPGGGLAKVLRNLLGEASCPPV